MCRTLEAFYSDDIDNQVMMSNKEYHRPDETWTIWVKTYEEFVERWVTKGRFHTNVPEDVIKSFLIVEHIMAHSWYHYPLYDEALTKVAGIVEMSVKLRTTQLGLPLTAPDKKGVQRQISLEKLIDAILRKEPGKDLNFELHHMRKVRNIVAHPKRYGFVGGIQWHLVRHCVNVLNMLFMTEKKCIEHTREKDRINAILKEMLPNCGILYLDGKKFLVENVHVTDALDPAGRWLYLLIAHPIYQDLKKAYEEQAYLPLFCLELGEVDITDTSLQATLLEQAGQIRIGPATKAEDLAVYERFSAVRGAASQHDNYIFETATSHQPNLASIEMLYRYLNEIGYTP